MREQKEESGGVRAAIDQIAKKDQGCSSGPTKRIVVSKLLEQSREEGGLPMEFADRICSLAGGRIGFEGRGLNPRTVAFHRKRGRSPLGGDDVPNCDIQASRARFAFCRLRIVMPVTPKPRSISVHAAGSGTAAAAACEMVSVPLPKNGLIRVNVPSENIGALGEPVNRVGPEN